MATDIGPRIGIDGEAEYRKQISNIIQSSKTLAAEMKAVTSSFDANTTAQEKAQAKSQILNQQIETQKERVKLLSDMLSKSAEKYGENDTKTLKWKEALANATTELNNMEKESDELGTSVEELGDDLDDTGEKTVSFGELLKANLTSEAIVAGVKAIATAVVDLGKAAAGMVKDAVEQYAEYEQLVGGVETLFKDSAGEVQDYARNAWKTAGMTANDYMDTAVGFSAALISGLEGDTEKAAKVTDMAISDMSDNWNKMGTAPESVMDAYAGFAKQQYTLLDNLKLGYGGTKGEMKRLLADAEKFSGVHYDIDNLADVYEAIHVIQGELDITGTTAKEASSTISGSTAAMKAAWQNLIVGFADSNADLDGLINDVVTSAETVFNNILPVVEQALAGLAGFVEKVAPMIVDRLPGLVATVLPGLLSAVSSLVTSLVSALPGIISVIMEQAPIIIGTFVNSLITAGTTMIPEIVSMGAEMVISLSTALVSSTGEIIGAGLELMTGLVTGIVGAIPSIIAAVPQIVGNIVNTLVGLIPTIINCGVDLLTALVDNLPTIISTIVAVLPQIVNSIITALINNIPQIVNAGVRLLVSLVQNLPQIIIQVVAAIPRIITGLVNAVVSSIPQIVQAGVTLLVSLVRNLPAIISGVVQAIPQIIRALVSAIGSMGGEMVRAGYNLLVGLGQGIRNAIGGVIQEAIEAGRMILNSIKGALGIHSPSTVFRDVVGKNLMLGLAEGIERETDSAVDAVQAAANQIGGVGFGLGGISSMTMGLPSRYAGGGYNTTTTTATYGDIVVNVTGAPGQDVNQLADIVADRIAAKVQRRRAAFA